jgi:CHAT domain-containing protein
LVGPAATAEAVNQGIREANHLYLATHARADEIRPGFSYLRLAGEERLYAIDLRRLPLNGKRVFLAACDTSAGLIVPGEEPFALAADFFRAGARSVVGTLWRIESKAVQRFAAQYYQKIGEGRTSELALAEVAREFIHSDDDELNVPRAWAAYVYLTAPY